MAVILNFNLPQIANSINQVICLYDPSPVFQFQQNSDFTYSILPGDQYKRDSNVASAGFPASLDPGPLVNGQLPGPSITTFPLPANSYVKNIPSQVYGTPVQNDNYTVLMINTALARIEPGFSRLRIDYTVYDSFNNTYTSQTFYTDCPFYEGWDVTARELNNIVGYIEGGIGFLQTEINIIQQEVAYALSREFWRGTSVSGQLANSGQITQGLQVGTSVLTAHTLPASEYSPLDAKPLPPLQAKGGNVGPIDPTEVSTFIKNWNAAGKVAQNNWILANTDGPTSGGSGPQSGNPPKTSSLLCENTDGTLTFWLYSVQMENTGQNATGFSQVIVGHVTTDASGADNIHGTVGAAIAMFGHNGGTTAPIPTDIYGSTTGSPLHYYNNSKYLYANSTDTTHLIASPYFPQIVTGSFDYVVANFSQGNGKIVYRAVLTPTVGAGAQLSFGSPNHITLSTGGSVNSYADNGALYGSTNPTVLVLNGALSIIPTISAVSFAYSNVCCIGGTYTLTGTNLSSNFNLYIGGLSHPQLNFTVQSTTSATFQVASGTPVGAQNIQLISKTDTTKVSNTIPVVISGTPVLTAVTPNSAKAGTQITLTGTGFGPYSSGNSFVDFAAAGLVIPSSWTDTQIVVTVPAPSTPQTYPYNSSVAAFTPCGGGSSPLAFTYLGDKPKTFTVTPTPFHVASASTEQFQATLYDPNANTTTVETSSPNIAWTIYGGTAPGTNQGSGNSTYGSVTQQGLYSAPVTIPPGQDGANGISTVRVQAVFTDTTGAVYTAIATVFIDLTASLSVTPNTATVSIPTTQQFIATFTLNGNNTDESFYATWSVNGVIGGNNSIGTIANGLYVPPVQAPPTNPLTISASYVYNGTRYQASAQIFVSSPPTTQMVLNVTSQINVYLGDGRFGYVPTGSTLTAHLNDYIYVLFAERLNAGYKFPDPSYMPVQQLTMYTKNADDSNVEQTLYNTASITIQPDGTTLTYRTVVLGLIDPSDGFFHSMWDIGVAPVLASTLAHGMAISVENANELKAFPADHHFKGSIMEYVEDLSGGAQSQLNALYNRANVVLAGSASYDDVKKTLFLTKPLRVLGVANDTYGILGIVPAQQIEVQENQFVYINKDYRLCVGNFSDYFASSKTEMIIVGTVLDKFYTTWPLINGLETDTSGVKSDGSTSYMRVGPLLVQWGTTDEYELSKKDSIITDKISFPMAYSTSCVVMTEPAESNGAFPAVQANEQSLTDFDIKIVNQQGVKIKTKASWLAIGV